MKKVLSLSLALLVLFSCFGAMAEKQEPFPETVEFSYLTQMWEPFSAENNLVSEYEKAMNVKMDVEWPLWIITAPASLPLWQAICPMLLCCATYPMWLRW